MAAASLRVPLHTSLGIVPKVIRVVMDFGFKFYFRAQRLSWWQRLRCTPMLFRAEYMVFQADAVAESAKDVDLDPARNNDHETVRRYKATFEAYKARFEALLRRANGHNEAVARQIDLGEEYLYLENKVTSSRAATHAEVLRLVELRSFDLRLLHSMTFALLGRPVDNELLDLLWPVEVLHDIADDLATYHQDIAAGLFNTYDAFVSAVRPGRARPASRRNCPLRATLPRQTRKIPRRSTGRAGGHVHSPVPAADRRVPRATASPQPLTGPSLVTEPSTLDETEAAPQLGRSINYAP